MAIGLTPKHTGHYALNDLTPEQFLVLATNTAAKQNLNISYLSLTGFIAYTDNGVFSRNAEVKVKIENGTASIQSSSTGGEMIDWGRNKKNVNLFIEELELQKQAFTREELDLKFSEIQNKLVLPEEDILKLPPATTTEKITDIFSIFKPVEGYFVTPILLSLNILIFILMVMSGVSIMSPDNQSLLNWGANFRPTTLEGEWWRLLSCCFIHIGIFHIAMNMYALLYIGVLLEPHLGKTRFITAYLLTGISSSLLSLWWHDYTISAGASGAIFGMYGVFLAMLTTNFFEKSARKNLLTSIALFVGYNLTYGLKSGVDNAGHIGGLLSGLVIGYAFIPSLKNPDQKQLKLGTIAALTILILVTSMLVYIKLPNDIGKYDAKMKDFSSMESMALAVYNLPPDTPKDKILNEIKGRGIYYWNENIKLIDGLKELNLPEDFKKRNALLKEYCELRLQSYELLYKSMAEETNVYDKQINEYNKRIEAKITELNAAQ